MINVNYFLSEMPKINLNFLHKADVVDIISPATACHMDEVQKIKNFIQKLDLEPNIFLEKETTLTEIVHHEFSSFSAQTRCEQFQKAVENPHSNIIWCSRGGYGSAEILPFLKKLRKPTEQKLFIGFSDISSLNHFLIQEWGWKIISAPMLTQITSQAVSNQSIEALIHFIFGKTTILKYALRTCIPTEKTIQADLTGGCISVLAGQFGTNDQIDWDQKILFLEDEGEDGERLDRYFQQILSIMMRQKTYPKAILLGNFLESNPHGTPKEKNITIAIQRFTKNLAHAFPGIALFEETSRCLGHSKNMMPLILGHPATITDGHLVQGDF